MHTSQTAQFAAQHQAQLISDARQHRVVRQARQERLARDAATTGPITTRPARSIGRFGLARSLRRAGQARRATV